MLNELLGVKPTGILLFLNNNIIDNHLFLLPSIAFLPSIPHLVYQYNLYTNYNSQIYCKPNKEIPE